MKLLVKNARILPMDARNHEIEKGYIIVENGIIIAVGPGEAAAGEYDQVLDATGKAAMPGFINTHNHAAMVLLRGYADDMPLMDWLQNKIWPAEAGLDHEAVYRGTMLACAEMIKSGTTCFNDMYFIMEAIGEAVRDSGMRAVLCRGMVGSGQESEVAFPETRSFIEKWHGAENGRITCMVGPHAPYTCNPDYLKRVMDLAEELDMGLHIHVAETIAEVNIIAEQYGQTPVEYLEAAGVFARPVLAAHCVHVTDSDIEIMRKYNVGVAHNPESNMKLGSGMAPVHEMLEKGIAVGLGTDGASSNNNLDMLQEMRTAAFLQKVKHLEPTMIDAYTALEMATCNGARALGMEDVIGSLKPGYKADIILLDLSGPHMQPLHNLTANIVYAAHAGDVDTVIIDGRIVMEARRILAFDEEQVIARASEAAFRLVGKS